MVHQAVGSLIHPSDWWQGEILLKILVERWVGCHCLPMLGKNQSLDHLPETHFGVEMLPVVCS